MATTTLVATITTTEELGAVDVKAGQRTQTVLTNLGNFITAFNSGFRKGTIDLQLNGGSATLGSGTITIAAGTGTVGATIGGTLVTVTWATSDTASAAALASAINANTTVNKLVVATSSAGVVTLKATSTGTWANGVAIAPSGTGVTSSATLTGGTVASANSITL